MDIVAVEDIVAVVDIVEKDIAAEEDIVAVVDIAAVVDIENIEMASVWKEIGFHWQLSFEMNVSHLIIIFRLRF